MFLARTMDLSARPQQNWRPGELLDQCQNNLLQRNPERHYPAPCRSIRPAERHHHTYACTIRWRLHSKSRLTKLFLFAVGRISIHERSPSWVCLLEVDKD